MGNGWVSRYYRFLVFSTADVRNFVYGENTFFFFNFLLNFHFFLFNKNFLLPLFIALSSFSLDFIIMNY